MPIYGLFLKHKAWARRGIAYNGPASVWRVFTLFLVWAFSPVMTAMFLAIWIAAFLDVSLRLPILLVICCLPAALLGTVFLRAYFEPFSVWFDAAKWRLGDCRAAAREAAFAEHELAEWRSRHD